MDESFSTKVLDIAASVNVPSFGVIVTDGASWTVDAFRAFIAILISIDSQHQFSDLTIQLITRDLLPILENDHASLNYRDMNKYLLVVTTWMEKRPSKHFFVILRLNLIFFILAEVWLPIKNRSPNRSLTLIQLLFDAVLWRICHDSVSLLIILNFLMTVIFF